MRLITRLISMPALLAMACKPLPPQTPTPKPPIPAAAEAPPQAPPSAIPDPATLPTLLDGLPGAGEATIALLHTSLGDLRCQLDTTRAPRAITSFIALATGHASWLDRDSGQLTQRPFYDDTIVHRVMPDLFIQLGDRSGTGLHGPGWQLPHEPGIPHDRAGLLILARSGDHSSGSQLLLTAAALPALASDHTALGFCAPVSLIHQMTRLPADASNRPLYPPLIHTITISRGSPL
jgi:peptidyl-prolyl cis-trans isomerase A (cyclophilin A)